MYLRTYYELLSRVQSPDLLRSTEHRRYLVSIYVTSHTATPGYLGMGRHSCPAVEDILGTLEISDRISNPEEVSGLQGGLRTLEALEVRNDIPFYLPG